MRERYQQNPTRNQGRGVVTNRGVEVSFSQAATGGALAITDRVTYAKITCYNCNVRGHYSVSCPSTDKLTNVVTSLQVGVSFTQSFPSTEDIIDPNWIILYSSSTEKTVKNKAILSNTRDCTEDKILLIHTNGGDHIFHQKVVLNIVPMTSHYDHTSLVNTLFMKDIQRFRAYASRWILFKRLPL